MKRFQQIIDSKKVKKGNQMFVLLASQMKLRIFMAWN